MPEPMIAGTRQRVDDVAGYVPLLVVADGVASVATARMFQERFPGSRVACLANPRDDQLRVRDESGLLPKSLGEAEALLAKPDRIVFGAGSVAALTEEWGLYLRRGNPVDGV